VSKKLIAFGVFAVVAAGICVRLGIWQLHRLDERRAKNALVLDRGNEEPLPMRALHGDTGTTHWRRVRVHGVADYGAEVVQTSRSQNGSPGVYVLTPVRPLEDGWGDTALVLLRGWLYSPDARTVDLVPAKEADTISVDALVTVFPPPRPGALRSPTSPNAVRALDHDTLSAMMRRPLAPAVLLALGDTVTRDVALITRIPPPSQSEGPHFSYAMQWFGFATVFIVGFLADARSSRRSPTPRTPPAS
jgi:surfeit locus 1 family protein